jgi:hypothetical protein
MDAPSLYRLVHVKSDIGHILFLRILYHIPYHGQKSDIISYPLSQLKKDRILYHISLPGGTTTRTRRTRRTTRTTT